MWFPKCQVNLCGPRFLKLFGEPRKIRFYVLPQMSSPHLASFLWFLLFEGTENNIGVYSHLVIWFIQKNVSYNNKRYIYNFTENRNLHETIQQHLKNKNGISIICYDNDRSIYLFNISYTFSFTYTYTYHMYLCSNSWTVRLRGTVQSFSKSDS